MVSVTVIADVLLAVVFWFYCHTHAHTQITVGNQILQVSASYFCHSAVSKIKSLSDVISVSLDFKSFSVINKVGRKHFPHGRISRKRHLCEVCVCVCVLEGQLGNQGLTFPVHLLKIYYLHYKTVTYAVKAWQERCRLLQYFRVNLLWKVRSCRLNTSAKNTS